MKKFIVSIDAGTTSNRTILFDLKGKPVFSSQKEFTQYFPNSGWVEHNPEEIWKTTIKTLKIQELEEALDSLQHELDLEHDEKIQLLVINAGLKAKNAK